MGAILIGKTRETYDYSVSTYVGKILATKAHPQPYNPETEFDRVPVGFVKYAYYADDANNPSPVTKKTLYSFPGIHQGLIIGVMTGNYTGAAFGSGYYAYEIKLYNPIWLPNGEFTYWANIMINGDLTKEDSLVEILENDGTATGKVFKDHRLRTCLDEVFPYHDPAYPVDDYISDGVLIRGVKYWDTHFGNVPWTGRDCPQMNEVSLWQTALAARPDLRAWKGYDERPVVVRYPFETNDHNNQNYGYNPNQNVGSIIPLGSDRSPIALDLFMKNSWMDGYKYNHGICWATHNNPSVNDSTMPVYADSLSRRNGELFGKMNPRIPNLTPNTLYYIREWQRVWGNPNNNEDPNQLYLRYGSLGRARTRRGNAQPELAIYCLPSNITSTSVKVGARVTKKPMCNEYGICYRAGDIAPTVLDNCVAIGSFKPNPEGYSEDFQTVTLTGLTAGTKYTYAVYAKTSDPNIVFYSNLENGIFYPQSANNNTFTTTGVGKTLPIVSMIATYVYGNIVSAEYQMSYNGNEVISNENVGICWGTSPNPTVGVDNTAFDSQPRGEYGKRIVNTASLQENTQYYFRAFATNSIGTAYSSNEKDPFVMDNVVITTSPASYITETSASISCVASSGAASAVTKKGICWSRNANPTAVALFKIEVESAGAGTYNGAATGLIGGVKYYAKAYVITDGEPIYGNEISFTTNTPVAIPVNPTIDTIANTYVGIGSVITETKVIQVGTSGIKTKGVVISNTANPTTIAGLKKGLITTGNIATINSLDADTNYFSTAFIENNSEEYSFGKSIPFKTLQVIVEDAIVNAVVIRDAFSIRFTITTNLVNVEGYGISWALSDDDLRNGNITDSFSLTNEISNPEDLPLSQDIYFKPYVLNPTRSEGTTAISEKFKEKESSILKFPYGSPGKQYTFKGKTWKYNGKGWARLITQNTENEQIQPTETPGNDIGFTNFEDANY